ncbi:TSCPD domain-containing protein [Methylovulum miyakonense]|uniref:TSCPD domain-containing protein n=1 Tax=Methylovulum miyakonense TaxID=645578 RepID=UPI000371D673|nr:NrdJb [Methylovulum miyakonense]
MIQQINKKITAYKVLSPNVSASNEDQDATPLAAQEPVPNLESMHENVARPEILYGSTYKIKTPQSEHALYITINDMILNQGSEHEERRPYEVFINSKNMEHFQWVLALTRVISAVFRKGGDACFLVDELKAVFDPRGGYFKKGGVFMPSLVAEIGCAIESHLKSIGMLKDNELNDHQKQFLAEKRREFDALHAGPEAIEVDSGFPAKALLCVKCQTKAVVLMDGCMTCLNCGDSKCS